MPHPPFSTEEPLDAEFDGERYDNDGQDPDGPCMSCPWPHACAASGECEATA